VKGKWTANPKEGESAPEYKQEYRVFQNDWSGLEVDYIHKYGEETYKY
jgi:hypothetical protein